MKENYLKNANNKSLKKKTNKGKNDFILTNKKSNKNIS